MNVSGSELRKGDFVQFENKLWQCMMVTHRTPGNLRAFVQVKLRNIMDGNQKEARFSSTENVEKVEIIERKMQYLYNVGDTYHFMDSENFEQIELNAKTIGDSVKFLSADLVISVCFHETTPLTVKLPSTMEFAIVEAEPEIKGASATTSYKNAKLDIGVNVLVPQFVKVGDRIKINTETSEYLERAKK